MDARTATVWPWGGDATIPLNIRSSNGLRLDCYLPRIDSLTLDETDKTKMQASYDDIVFDGVFQSALTYAGDWPLHGAASTCRVIISARYCIAVAGKATSVASSNVGDDR